MRPDLRSGQAAGPVMKRQRITLVQLARFGDLIQTSPLIRRIKKSFPDSHLAVVTDKRAASVAGMLDGVDEVIPLNLASIPDMLSGDLAQDFSRVKSWADGFQSLPRSDYLFLLNQGDLTSSIASLIPADKLLGPLRGSLNDTPHRLLTALLSNRSYNPFHLSEIWAAYQSDELPPEKPALRSGTTGTGFAILDEYGSLSNSNYKLFALNLGAGAAGRRPLTENLAALLRFLLENPENKVVLLGTKADLEIEAALQKLVSGEQADRIIALAGKTRIEDLPGILKRADLLISSDTGTLQLAAATDTPSLGLFFGGANPVETGCFRSGSVALVRMDTLSGGGQMTGKAMLYAGSVAQHMVENKPLEEYYDEDEATALLVARPAPVGLLYEPARFGEDSPVGKGRRWRPLLEYLLGTGLPQDYANSRTGNTDGVELGDSDGRQLTLLRKLHSQVLASGGELKPEWGEEERWLAHIIAAFPVETANWLNVETEKRREYA